MPVGSLNLMSKASPHNAIELQKLLSHNVRTVHELLSPGWEPRNQYCKWFPESLANGFFTLQLVVIKSQFDVH